MGKCKTGHIITCLAVLLCAFSLCSPQSYAASNDTPFTKNVSESKPSQRYANARTRKRQSVSRVCATKLEAAQKAIEQEQWPSAEITLLSAAKKRCSSSFEKSQVWNYLGYVYFSQENYDRAIATYLKLTKETDAEDKLKISAYYAIAQLYFQREDYANAAHFIEHWINDPQLSRVQAVDPQTKILLAQAYYQLKKTTAALRLLQPAIRDYKATGRIPPEGWLTLQSQLYFSQKQYSRALPVLKYLILHYPRYRYWQQLGGLYQQLGKNVAQLVSSEVIYFAGALSKERELLALAYLYLGAKTPYLAAKILERGLRDKRIQDSHKHWELLGLAWQQAGEDKKALPVLERAAKLSGKGKTFARLANIYLGLGENRHAVKAAKNALHKGELKRASSTHLVLGNAQLNLHCYDAAAAAFKQASKYRASAKNARQWLNYTQAEKERVKQLREAGADVPSCST